MLAVQAHYHDGHIQIATKGLPRDSKVVVLFLTPDADNTSSNLSPDQQAALFLQSQSGFSKNVLLDPAEDCWNNA
jgi:hypothetical protein